MSNLIKEHDRPIARTIKAAKRFLNEYSEDFVKDWMILKQADVDDHINTGNLDWGNLNALKNNLKIIEEENSAFNLASLNINGSDLLDELGLKPGKEIGQILNSLLDKVINEELSNNKEDLLIEARNIYYNIEDTMEIEK